MDVNDLFTPIFIAKKGNFWFKIDCARIKILIKIIIIKLFCVSFIKLLPYLLKPNAGDPHVIRLVGVNLSVNILF